VDSTAIQNNFGKYLDLASTEEILITKNGRPVSRLLGENTVVSFLSERLLGIFPSDVNEDSTKNEKLKRPRSL
jgi:antitoxin (DNA-binding transcriptional repressor) of toxin-antitoxin stability system